MSQVTFADVVQKIAYDFSVDWAQMTSADAGNMGRNFRASAVRTCLLYCEFVWGRWCMFFVCLLMTLQLMVLLLAIVICAREIFSPGAIGVSSE